MRGRASQSAAGRLEVAALIAIAVLLILGTLVTSGSKSTPPSLRRLEVHAGDSLWALAAQHPVDGMTTAQVADLMARTNDLDGGLIVQGQYVLVPDSARTQRLASR